MLKDELLEYAQKIANKIYAKDTNCKVEVVQSNDSIILSVNRVATVISEKDLQKNEPENIAQSILFAVNQLYSLKDEESGQNE